MNERTIHLRVKVKSLVAEAKIIRAEAKKTSGKVKCRLNDHRKTVVRRHTRHNLLAYGLLRGTPYILMEAKCEKSPDFKWIGQLAKKFGGNDEQIANWIQEARFYIENRELKEAA